MSVDLSCEVKILHSLCPLPVFFYFHNRPLYITVKMSLIGFKRFFLDTFSRVSPIAFRRFFNTIYIGILSSAYPHFFEIVASFMIVETVDGEDLLPLYGSKTQNRGYLVVAIDRKSTRLNSSHQII